MNPRELLLVLPVLAVIGAAPAQAGDRPNLSNTRIGTPFSGNGHNSTLDGRIFIANVGEDHTTVTTRWQARVFRPEALTYSSEGAPQFAGTFSAGRVSEVHGGENALAFCFEDPDHLYTMEGAEAVYRPWVFESRMYGGGADANHFRRRRMTLRVSQPFTPQAEISGWDIGEIEYLSLVGGGVPQGIEPTMTADGRLLIYQGGPLNNGQIDHLMYVVNSSPCAATGWSSPLPVSAMYDDPNPLVDKYPLSHKPLLSATGDAFGTSRDLILAAYPWVDPEGRDVFYMSVPNPVVGGRREAVTVIGADTGYKAVHIDGGINATRDSVPKLFYSGPMWRMEQERVDVDRSLSYLPATHIHDVVPLFGSNTGDYNEVDLGEIVDPFHLLYLPMNELVTRGGEYDLGSTPDLSGYFQTGTLIGDAEISSDLSVTTSASLWTPHGKGKALVLQGEGGLRVRVADGAGRLVDGFTAELSLKPDSVGACANRQILLKKAGVLEIALEANGQVSAGMRVGRAWVSWPTTPALPRQAWSHLAFTWDGISGALAVYVNGLPVGDDAGGARGTTRLGPGFLFVGTSPNNRAGVCDTDAPFRGAIDEVILYAHARSARSACMHAPGSDCMDEAIQVPPSLGQLVLSNNDPFCNGPEDLGSLACETAMHRVCAQVGAVEALSSASNIWDTAAQLVSGRPPTSMAGVPAGETSAQLTVACAPIEHESVAITFEELAGYHESCRPDTAMTTACGAAVHRFCASLGWTSGSIFDITSRPWVSCFDSELTGQVAVSSLGAACTEDINGGGCALAVGAYCQTRGLDGGVIAELPPGGMADVHCFEASVLGQWSW